MKTMLVVALLASPAAALAQTAQPIPVGAIAGATTPGGVFDLNYRRFQAFLGARYFF